MGDGLGLVVVSWWFGLGGSLGWGWVVVWWLWFGLKFSGGLGDGSFFSCFFFFFVLFFLEFHNLVFLFCLFFFFLSPHSFKKFIFIFIYIYLYL